MRERIEKILSAKFFEKSWLIIALVAILVAIIAVFSIQSQERANYQKELETALKEDAVEDFEIFGDRNQYVAINYDNPVYYNSEDVVPDMLIGRNHFVRFYDSTASLHQAYMVTYDIEQNMEKRVIDLTEVLEKLPDYKTIKEIQPSIRNIEGIDYVFLKIFGTGRQSKKNYAYNLDTDELLTENIPSYELSEDEQLYFGSKRFTDQKLEAAMWKFFEGYSNLKQLVVKIPGKHGDVSMSGNVIFGLRYVDTSNPNTQINLFTRYPKVKTLYDNATFNDFLILTRQGEKGAFPAPPTEPKKPERRKLFSDLLYSQMEEIGFYKGSKTLSDAVYEEALANYEQELQNYQENELKAYNQYKEEHYEEQANLYFSPENQTDDILDWVSTDPNAAISLTLRNDEGSVTKVNNFAAFREWFGENRETVLNSLWYYDLK